MTQERIVPTEPDVIGPPGEEPVELVEADPAWPQRFEAICGRLTEALGSVALRIDHIGSTAVPGIPSKPVIDVQISVADVDAEGTYRSGIEGLGWVLRLREPGHRFFRPPAGRPRDVHIHVCSAGSTWERDHLLFRDYLRAHPARAAAYAALKWELVRSLGRDRNAYTSAKDPFIRETVGAAEDWARTSGWRVP